MFKSKKNLYKIRYKMLSGNIYEDLVSAKNADKALKIFRKTRFSNVDIVAIEKYIVTEVEVYCQ